MKKLKNLWVVIFVLTLLSSCQSPSLYEEEIIDVVKFNIASADSYCDTLSELYEDPSISMAALLGYDPTDLLMSIYSDFEDCANELFLDGHTYQQALVVISDMEGDDNQEFAIDILSNYNDLSVKLSEYTLVFESDYQKTWSFKELNKDIEFFFTIEFGEDDDMWYCEPTEKSMEKYLSNKML